MEKRLSFTDFTDYIREHLQDGWWEDRKIEIYKVKKNNGKELTAIILPRDRTDITPTFYLEEFYEIYGKGYDLQEMISWIRGKYEEAEEAVLDVDVAQVINYDFVKDRIMFRMIHMERNRELLKDCPHVELHDLAVTFRVVIRSDHGALASALVTYDQLKMWDVSVDEILLRAEKNTRRAFPPRVCSMNDFLISRGFEPMGEDDVMYVATNKQVMYGASVILYDGLLERFADYVNCSFYVLPSSVHEVLFIPDRPWMDIDPFQLEDMVGEANSSVVEQEDFLSDSVYYYDRKKHQLLVYDSSASCHFWH